MAMHQINPQGAKLASLDPIWDRVRSEAEDIVRREPELATFIYSTVLHHDRLEDSVVHRLTDRLDHSALSGDLIRQAFDEALRDAALLTGQFYAPDPTEITASVGGTIATNASGSRSFRFGSTRRHILSRRSRNHPSHRRALRSRAMRRGWERRESRRRESRHRW